MDQNNFQQLGEILNKAKKEKSIKPPAHEWQDLALRIIKELNIPGFKRNSVFAVCKKYPKEHILNSMNDTKELCHTGDKWKYFFKIIGGK